MVILDEHFLSEAVERFDFLVERHGYARSSERHEWFAQISFSRPDSSIKIFYGDRELCGNVSVARSLRGRLEPSEYALWEWLEALNVPDAPKTSVEWIQNRDQLSRFLRDASRALDLYLPQILRAGPNVTERLEEARDNRIARSREEQAVRDHRVVSARASEAFRAHQFGRVVQLLEPFRSRLSPAESKKLAYARKRLASDAG